MKSATNVLLLSQPSLLNVLLCFGDTTLVTFVGLWVFSEIKLSRALWPEVLFVITLLFDLPDLPVGDGNGFWNVLYGCVCERPRLGGDSQL